MRHFCQGFITVHTYLISCYFPSVVVCFSQSLPHTVFVSEASRVVVCVYAIDIMSATKRLSTNSRVVTYYFLGLNHYPSAFRQMLSSLQALRDTVIDTRLTNLNNITCCPNTNMSTLRVEEIGMATSLKLKVTVPAHTIRIEVECIECNRFLLVLLFSSGLLHYL